MKKYLTPDNEILSHSDDEGIYFLGWLTIDEAEGDRLLPLSKPLPDYVIVPPSGKYEDKRLAWSNGKEWGEIHCPMTGKHEMTYWGGGPCYDTYTVPMVDSDNEVFCYRYDHDAGAWHDGSESLGEYEGKETCCFG